MSPATEVPLVLLFGAGVESTTLVQRLLAEGKMVWPVYQHWGLHWEDCELDHARRFCKVRACERLRPLMEIRRPPPAGMEHHWAVTGIGFPRAADTFHALEIPQRNHTLLVTAARQCAQMPELRLVMGTTADNRFSDGSRAFFDQCERQLGQELDRPVRILTPLIDFDKTQVIRMAERDTLALSFSCLDPQQGRHCGLCYKCGRRQDAFRAAGVEDPTFYAHPA